MPARPAIPLDHDPRRRWPPARRRLGRRLAPLVAAGLALAACGCGRPGGGAGDAVHVAGADRKVRLQLASGPFEELVVLRDTAGRFVVSGLCFFPDGTRINVALYDSTDHFLARTQPAVDKALLRSLPLGSEDGRGWPPGQYAVELSANFAPGAQTPEVLRAFGSGRQFRGPGMTESLQGHPAYSRRFHVRL